MAEISVTKVEGVPAGDKSNNELSNLKKELEAYRELLVPLNKVIEWDQSYYPAVLVGVITLIFSIVWYLEPSVLTTFCLLGVIVCGADYAVPFVSAQFLKGEWTVVEERQFDAICTHLLNAKLHLSNFRRSVFLLKRNKPKVYLLLMMGAFLILAWLGSLIDNLLLTYLIVTSLTLVPGLRKHSIIQKAMAQISEKISSVRAKKSAKIQ